jgi:CBS domain-containing protein
VAALDAVAYVRRISPFDLLPEERFLEAARGLEIRLFEPGARLASAGGEPLRHLHVVRKGAVRIELDGQVLQVIEEGEVFGTTSLITKKATLDVIVEERLLAYCLPAAGFEALLADARFATHFAVSLTERLKASLEHPRIARFEPDIGEEVGRLICRPPVWVASDASVGEAARVMRDEHVSSVLLRCEPAGIVTDRDLRNRVLAEDVGPEAPAIRVCSRPVRTVAAAAPVYEAWRTLLESGVNHLPVTREEEVVGVLTSTDLLRHSALGPVAVLRRFEQLHSREGLPGYGPTVAGMVSALLSAGLDAVAVAGLVAELNRTLLRRLLHLAERELGDAPAPYAWLAFGSEGRCEQVLPGEQDHALVYDDGGVGRRDWFRALAERVEADLAVAGFPPGPPDRMALDRCGTRSEWLERFEALVAGRPGEVGPLFDLRRSGGTLDVAPLEAALAGQRDPFLVRALARHALALEPPLAMALRLRGRASRVDLERQGLRPIVSLARCYAVELGSRRRSTLSRLEDALRAGIIAERTQEAIAEAFRFLLQLRAAVRLRAMAAGRGEAEPVAIAELTGMERTRLKEAFRAIRRWQEGAYHRYRS